MRPPETNIMNVRRSITSCRVLVSSLDCSLEGWNEPCKYSPAVARHPHLRTIAGAADAGVQPAAATVLQRESIEIVE